MAIVAHCALSVYVLVLWGNLYTVPQHILLCVPLCYSLRRLRRIYSRRPLYLFANNVLCDVCIHYIYYIFNIYICVTQTTRYIRVIRVLYILYICTAGTCVHAQFVFRRGARAEAAAMAMELLGGA